MVDTFTLLLSHGTILLAAWRLLWRPDLDHDPDPMAVIDGDRDRPDA